MGKLPILSDSAVKNSVKQAPFSGRAALITLGCAKNQVDSEVMLGVLKQRGFELVNDTAEADVAVVNTCGFLQSAVEESIDCILELAEQKKTGRLRKLVVAGCMVSRYGEELRKSMPEVDHFLSTDQLLDVGNACADGALREGGRPYFLYDDTLPRSLSGAKHSAYIKISEGCNRPCTFCIIPKIRGPMRSRLLDSVVREANALGEQGVKEVNLVAQDLTAYGSDARGPGIVDLLQALDRSAAIRWIRLLYAYPLGVTDKLLETISSLPSVCEYLDLPFQHVSEALLKEMKRPLGRFAPRALTEYIRKHYPEIHLRTTFIVGFPGETEADLIALEEFVAEGHFSSVGVFQYSQEEGTPAGEMKLQVSAELKAERQERVMLAQKKSVKTRLKAFIGREIDVLVDGAHEDTDLLLSGRTRFQAPEVDGQVIINDIEPGLQVNTGDLARVRISACGDYDLIGTIVGMADYYSIKNRIKPAVGEV